MISSVNTECGVREKAILIKRVGAKNRLRLFPQFSATSKTLKLIPAGRNMSKDGGEL